MTRALVWLRRDLRLYDHAALSTALSSYDEVFLTFIFDKTILDPLLKKGLKKDRRVDFIWQSLEEINHELKSKSTSSGLMVRYGDPQVEIITLAKSLGVDAVLTNRDYEPSAIARDHAVEEALKLLNISFMSFKDQVIFEKREVLTQQGNTFSVFTPFKNAWFKRLTPDDLAPYPCFNIPSHSEKLGKIPKTLRHDMPSLESMGFDKTDIDTFVRPGMSGASQLYEDFLDRMDQYQATRNFPSIKGPSYLSTHSRFGTISIRALARESFRIMSSGSLGASTWLNELVWRDFYFMILSNHPRLANGVSFKPSYDQIIWESGDHAQKLFASWCTGQTGYPLVDAAMRQLNATGYMHNRLRMVAACFLVKDLGIDWRWGESYFTDQLNDFDFAANNGGWQWASSSGCDAQPYFRIFNPITQSEKFDKDGKFIRKYCPELSLLSNKSIHAPWLAGAIELESAEIRLDDNYPLPIVDHSQARLNTLQRFSVVKSSDSNE